MMQLLKLKNYYKKILIFIFLFFIQIQSKDCTICLDELNYETSIQLPCNHTYCNKCLDEWIKTQLYTNCPNCRFYIGDQNTHNSYKNFIISIKNHDLQEAITNADKLYIQLLNTIIRLQTNMRLAIYDNIEIAREEISKKELDINFWYNYLVGKLIQLIRSKFKNNRTNIKKFGFLKDLYFKLYNTDYIKQNRLLKCSITKLIQQCTNKIYNKQQLTDAINFFKEDKQILKLVTTQYLNVSG